MEISPFQQRAWAEISIDAIKKNFQIVKKTVKSSKICCVVKANAYGHGAVELSRIYQDIGADFLAVSNIEEALQLRFSGVFIPIIILGYTNPVCVEALSKYDISQCIFSKEYAELIAQYAIKNNIRLKIHLKIDTGMGRIGFRCKGVTEHNLADAIDVCRYPCFITEGIFTHFSVSDEGNDGYQYTNWQYDNFRFAINYLAEHQVYFELHHCANSAAIFDYPEMHMDMVRAGIVLYGLRPSEKVHNLPSLAPVLKLKSIVDHIKEITKGDSISYGRTYKAERNTVVATIPIGYADGLLRSNSRILSVEINNQSAPIIGHICMDQCMVDISQIDHVNVGCIATIYGDKKYNNIDIIARNNSTINYEILCSIGERVPRVYIEDGNIIAVSDKLLLTI